MPTVAKPLISIVTVSLNSARTIADTLNSVAAQTLAACEHIVIDGGSQDETLGLIEGHIRKPGQFISEPDRGIADAMNKGIRLASGEWLLFLQSDDFLASPDTLAQAVEYLQEDIDVCAFPVLFGPGIEAAKLLRPRGAGFWLNLKNGFCHQGTFIRKSLFERIGDYDTQFKIAMDYEFFLRAYRSGARFRRFPAPAISLMRSGGISSQLSRKQLQARFAEERRIHLKWSSRNTKKLYTLYWAFYPRYRWIRESLR